MLNTIAFLPPIVPEYDCKGIWFTEPTSEVGGIETNYNSDSERDALELFRIDGIFPSIPW